MHPEATRQRPWLSATRKRSAGDHLRRRQLSGRRRRRHRAARPPAGDVRLKGWADPKVIERYAHHWIAIGQAGRFFRLAACRAMPGVLFIGTRVAAADLADPPRLADDAADAAGSALLSRRRRPAVVRRGQHRSRAAACASSASRTWRPRSLRPKACSADASRSERDQADIARALALIAALGPFDVGQAAVVADNHVLAVEAAEGTDNMLDAARRAAQARPGVDARRRGRSGQGAQSRGRIAASICRRSGRKRSRTSRVPVLPGLPSPPAARSSPNRRRSSRPPTAQRFFSSACARTGAG